MLNRDAKACFADDIEDSNIDAGQGFYYIYFFAFYGTHMLEFKQVLNA